MPIKNVTDSIRGCGKRKPGGLYLMTEPLQMQGCGKLPIPLTTCPCCGNGIRPARGWTWIDMDALAATVKCDLERQCCTCPLGGPIGRVGLLWVGESFYPTPQDWMMESSRLGVSRRIHRMPKGFVLGETCVAVAHRKALSRPCDCAGTFRLTNDPCKKCGDSGTVNVPAVFHLFKPTEVQYVTAGDESDDEIERLEKRGITPVKVTVQMPDGKMVGV